MTGIGTVIPGLAGLSVRIPEQDWHFLLRRADFMADRSFGALHNAPISAQRVCKYLPNWSNLDWVRIPENIITRCESQALDLPYKVNVMTNFRSSLTHEGVVEAFLGFMAHSKI
ncbi:MAG: hypothetical protein A2W21_15450 [Betaproteobacteria bacterium RBG_16_66_20]|nr:MAG: hypothetical protein A2W21_15450 [Betaproteobacteria bacterium RBG_16_66_20]